MQVQQSANHAKSLKEPVERICQILLCNHHNGVSVSTIDSAAMNGIEISPTIAGEVLKRLSNAGLLSLSFFRWAERHKGIKHPPDHYNTLIESLGKIKQFKLAWSLVEEMKRQGTLSKDAFALISRRYARARRVKEAIEAFERMEKYGLSPELEDYNKLLDTLCKSKNVESAHKVFDKWKNVKFQPDVKTYTVLLEGWGMNQNLLRVDEVYREMKCNGLEPDVVSYGIIINAYCKARKYEEAVQKFHEMEKNGIQPSPHIYCTMINGLGSDRRLDQALEFFRLAKANGCAMEGPTYNAVVGAYCWSMRFQDARKTMDEMRVLGFGPNSRTYDIVLHHLIKVGRMQDAYVVFQTMSGEPGCEPTASTYEIIVQMFCNVERTDMAVRVWGEMKARGFLPAMHLFSTMINSLCHENKAEDAFRYFEEMMDVGMRPPAALFKSLKQALVDEGREDMVLVLIKKFERFKGDSNSCLAIWFVSFFQKYSVSKVEGSCVYK